MTRMFLALFYILNKLFHCRTCDNRDVFVQTKKQPASRELPLLFSAHPECVAAHLVIAGKALDYNCPGSTSFSLGGKLASYFSNSSGIRSVTK